MQKNDHTFKALSEQAMNAQKRGDFVWLSQTYKELAGILHKERRYADEIKSRMLAYYLDLSGVSTHVHVDEINTMAIVLAAGFGKIGETKLSEIYFSAIREDVTPRHTMTVVGSYRMLRMCLKNQWNKVDRIVEILQEKGQAVVE